MSGPLPDWAENLGLQPHPEGGWFVETWRSDIAFTPEGYPEERPTATAILFLLLPGQESAWHRVRSAELWFHHRGSPLELAVGGDGAAPSHPLRQVLGPDLVAGQRPQLLVPEGHWQAAHPLGDEPVLVSCVVAPGFDFADFELL